MRRNIVILTGAGAALPWGAPTTKVLTDLIRKDTEFQTKTSGPLGEYLYLLLRKHYSTDPDSVNFETIIDALEDLYDFISAAKSEGYHEFKTHLPAIFQQIESVNEEILDRVAVYPKRSISGIPVTTGELYPVLDDDASYLATAIRHFINMIVDAIDRYESDVHTNRFDSVSAAFRRFIQFAEDNFRVRYYTLNYDQFPARFGYSWFSGFEDSGGVLQISPNRILDDDRSQVSYNLHGSIHFNEGPTGHWTLTPSSSNHVNGGSNLHDQKGRAMLRSNILTGLSKPSRILQDPFNLFLQRFSLDCRNADLIVTIGYSGGDPHVNKAIQQRFDLPNPRFMGVGYIHQFETALGSDGFMDPWIDEWRDAQIGFPKGDAFDERIDLKWRSDDWILSQKKLKAFYCRGTQRFLETNAYLSCTRFTFGLRGHRGVYFY